MTISVCIATHRRAERLAALLDDLAKQTLRPEEIVVVDNHAEGSARDVVERFRVRVPFPVHYEIQPERNISLTRNRTVALAGGEWLAFVDDDERAPPEWLARLFAATQRYEADGVLAPVEPEVPDSAPAWIRAGKFYDFPHLPSGTVVPLNRMRFGNVILRGDRVRAESGPFDVRYGLVAGEDGDLLIRLVEHGAKVVWCDEAIVREPVESSRLRLRWLLMRALGGGQEFARKTAAGRYGPISRIGRVLFFCRALAQCLAAAILAAASLPFGRTGAARWLIKASANLGKMSIFWGSRYAEYA